MEIEPVVEHEPADEGMKWKPQSTDEVGEKHDPLVGSWGMICPSSGSRCAMSTAKYPAAQRFAISFSFTMEATHLPPAPDMSSCAEKTWARALELEGQE